MRAQLRNIYLNVVGAFKKAKPGIHILNSHYVTPNYVGENDARIFEDFLIQLSTHGKLVTLQEATERITTNDIPDNEVLIALTFDDGFKECFGIIAPLLEKYNTRGGFFINANYIASSPDYQKEINTRLNVFTKKPMNWEEIKTLHHNGHVIGSHTLDHMNLADLNKTEIRTQLTKNKELLESELQYDCTYFAWTYGQMKHFPDIALDIASDLHPYIFSGTDATRYFSRNGKVINRRHIEPFWVANHINFFLSTEKK